MQIRTVLLSINLLITAGCGGDKHLPSSNPPEYDPKKAHTTPAASLSTPTTSVAKPSDPSPPPMQLPPLEPGPNEKGEWKEVPVKPESLQLFKSAKSPCEAVSNIVQGLGSGMLFAGKEGQALKQSLGSQAESVAQSLDQQLFDILKAQLGPNVANCPPPVPASQNSGLEQLFSPARVVRTNGLSNGSFHLAQASAVTPARSESRQEAPPGWVGWKTTARSIWPETAGNRRSMVTILGGKVLKCPTPEGVVPGDFEFAVVLDQTIVESGVTRMIHIGLHASVALKGQVGDDAKVQYIEGNLTAAAERNGTDVPTSVRRQIEQFRFIPSRDEFYPGFPTNVTVLSATGWDLEGATLQENSFVSDAVAAVMLWGGQNYLDAEREWNKPNSCVEITFTPSTKTRRFIPNESYHVKTELKTKKEQAVVPAKFKEAKELPRERNGTVSPREEESQPNTPAMFTYQAPPTRVRHSGFWVAAVSRAGVAQAMDREWELAEGLRLRFSQRIMADPQSPKAKGGWAQFDGAVQFDVSLEQYAEGLFRGEINLVRPMVVRHVKYGACGSASRTEHWLVTAHVNPNSESMDVRFGFTTSNEQGSWTCGGVRDELHDDLFEILESANMPTRTGMKKDFNARNEEFLEWLSVTVVEGLD